MAANWTLALFLLAAVVSIASGSRIVGGQPTTINEYPSIVQVDYLATWRPFNWAQACAANIITPFYVVSAAHCFDGLFYHIENRRIRAGSSNRNTGGIIVRFESRINHPSYGTNGNDGDICVAKLVSALTFDQVIQPVVIIAHNDPHNHGPALPDNVPVVHAGWGTLSSGGIVSPVLRDVTIYTINNELCTERYIDWSSTAIVTKNMICAGILDIGGKDACQGDSGGPLYYIQPNDGSQLLVGIISWGRGCGLPHFPGVSTSVASYSNWIVKNAV